MGSQTAPLQETVRAAGLDYGAFEQAQEAWAWLQDRVPRPARLRVIGDDDSDGINSAYVLSTALRRAGYEVEVKVMPVHSEADADGALRGTADAYLIADAGSSLLEHIDSHHVPVLVLDHHRVFGYQPQDAYEFNPRRQGGDKVWHVSASVVSLLFALALNERNWDLGFSAVAGGISDRQHLGGLNGLLGYAVEGSVRAGVLTRSQGLTLVGQTALEAVADSVDPYFVDLTGDPAAARGYLESLRVAPGDNPLLLAHDTGRRLADDLTSRLRAKTVVLDRMHPLFGERLLLKHASGVPTVFGLAQLLEAATAERAHEIALRLLSGASEARKEAQTLAKHRLQRILGEIQRLKSIVHEEANLRWAESQDGANTGVYAHTFLTFIHGDDKPFAILSRRGNEAKFSARGSPRLYGSGVDLSIGMSEAAQALGGHGGGHPGASGATVPWERRQEFIAALDRGLGALRRRPPA